MQVSGLVVTSTWGLRTEEELGPPPPRFPGGVDQVPGCWSLSEELSVAPPPWL